MRALHSLVRPGGRIAYTTISIAPGLTAAQRRRAQRTGPSAVAARTDPDRMLHSAGFADVEALDLTAEFARTARAWLTGWEAHAETLVALEPPGEFEKGQHERRAKLAAIEDGLLRRRLFSATRRP